MRFLWCTALLLPFVLFLVSSVYLCFPKYTGTTYAKHVSNNTKIARNRNNVPYIEAELEEDAMFALGYVHAQDRLWQLDMLRRAATGRLSEFFGEYSLNLDKFSRNIGFAHYSKLNLKYQNKRVHKNLVRYSQGINHYVSENNLPLEYKLFWVNWEKWNPVDTLAIYRYLSFALNFSWGHEILRNEVEKALGANLTDFVLPYELKNLRNQTFIVDEIPKELLGNPTLPNALPPAEQLTKQYLKDLYEALDFSLDSFASNSWAIAGNFTKSGKPILSNDPHLHTGFPSLFYLVDIQTPSSKLSGATIAGVPIVIAGKSEYLSWGVTSMAGDAVDLYVEKRHPANSSLYQVGEDWVLISERKESIGVRWSEPRSLKIETTRHGPVLHKYNTEPWVSAPTYVPNSNYSFVAIKWVANTEVDSTLNGFFKFSDSKSVQEARQALKEVLCPHFSLVMTSRTGDIAFQVIGKIPMREFYSVRPLPGYKNLWEWKGVVPFEEMLYQVNPQKGYIVAANNFPGPPGYKHFVSYGGEFADGRAERITDLVKQKISQKLVDAYDMLEMQCDTFNIYARDMMPSLLAFASKLTKVFDDWDFKMVPTSKAGAVFSIWQRNIAKALTEDKLPPDVTRVLLRSPQYMQYVVKTVTEKTDSVADMLEQTLQKATQEAKESTWGEIHKVKIGHMPLQSIVAWTSPVGGTDVSPHASKFDWGKDFTSVHGPILRLVVDWDGPSKWGVDTPQLGSIFSSPSKQLQDFHECRVWDWHPHEALGEEVVEILPLNL
mgnify:FL=1